MSDITINYKGSSIATMDASGTKTLLTDGKYCEDDIDIIYVQPSAGGVTNVVVGYFTASTRRQSLDVTLSYTGNGYPVAALIYPHEGHYVTTGQVMGNAVPYNYNAGAFIKMIASTPPNYAGSGDADKAGLFYTSLSGSSAPYNLATNRGASLGTSSMLAYVNDQEYMWNYFAFTSKTNMRIDIAESGSNKYGFAPGIRYDFVVVYSE